MSAESPAPIGPPPAHPGISRRNALLLWFGQADKVALERDQQSAIDGALGYAARAAAPEAAAAPSRGFARLIPDFVRRGFTPKS